MSPARPPAMDRRVEPGDDVSFWFDQAREAVRSSGGERPHTTKKSALLIVGAPESTANWTLAPAPEPSAS